MRTLTPQLLQWSHRGAAPVHSPPGRAHRHLLLLLSLLLAACQDDPDQADEDQDGYTLAEGDCDDQNAAVHPSTADVCNGLDDNCDGQLDEDLTTSIHYQDEDGDGFGSPYLPIETCDALPGVSTSGADCNDAAAEIYPGAFEEADGLDNNCNGIIDEQSTERYYRDADLDGFGSASDALEYPAAGYIQSRGDCDDTNKDIHPGAVDTLGNSIDEDCGGSDGRQPHVGLSPDSLDTLQEALNQAAPFDMIWVGPGNYKEQILRFNGLPATLISTHFASETTLDGDGVATVLAFDQGEQPNTTVDGFSVTGAPATAEGAVSILGSAPTLLNLRVARNACMAFLVSGGGPTLISVEVQSNSSVDGAGIRALDSTLTVASSTFIRNQSTGGRGAAIYTEAGSLTVLDSLFDGNLASWGGAIAAVSSDVTLDALWMAHNLATSRGGAVALSDSNLWMSRSHLEKNAGYHAAGGITADASSLEISSSALLENYGYSAGGLEVSSSPTLLTNVSFLGNLGVVLGGAVRSYCSRLTMHQSTLVGNLATLDGGAVAYHQCSVADQLRVQDSILSWNAAALFYLTVGQDQLLDAQVQHSLLYNPFGQLTNLELEQEDNLYTDPLFVGLSLDRNPYNDDLHLRPGSPALNVGGGTDLDGGALDLGAFGGQGGDDYTRDADKDGLFDGWESLYGTDPTRTDAQADPDKDGLANLEELTLGALPLSADSDQDDALDGEEANLEGDPTDWFIRPGGLAVPAQIPEDFPTIQAGVDAIRLRGTLLLAPGTYHETLDLTLKHVELQGAGQELTSLEGPQEGSVVTAVGAEITFWDLSITGGFPSKDSEEEYTNGAGLTVSQSVANLTRVWVHDNLAANGAGVAFWRSTGALVDCTASFNEALEGGGGIASFYSDLTVLGGVYSDNTASSVGGGIASQGSKLTLEGLLLERNSAGYGGGLYIQAGTNITLADLTVAHNSSGLGGGIYFWGSGTLTNLNVYENTANDASGIYLYSSAAEIEGARFVHNHLGSAFISGSSLITASNVAVVDNDAKYWSGLVISYSTMSLNNITVAGNTSEEDGAGLRSYSSTGDITGLQVTENRGIAGRGALELEESSPALAGLVVASNTAMGVLLASDSLPSILNSILAYNPEGNLMPGNGQGTQSIPVTYSDLYNPVGLPNMGVSSVATSNRTLEPQFQTYDAGLPTDFHLRKGSPLVDTGAPGVLDRDGSKGDLGLYGGPLGASWDRDHDALPDYFWPGTWNDAPSGINKGAYDEDDTDALLP